MNYLIHYSGLCYLPSGNILYFNNFVLSTELNDITTEKSFLLEYTRRVKYIPKKHISRYEYLLTGDEFMFRTQKIKTFGCFLTPRIYTKIQALL